MALKWHPDRCEDKVNAERMIKQVNEIYGVLTKEKDSYDRYLRRKLNKVEEESVWIKYANQTSSDAWSTTRSSVNLDEMLRRIHEQMQDNDFINRKPIIDRLATKMKTMSREQLKEVENYIDFIGMD